MTETLNKSAREIFGSTVLTFTCYWPSSICIPTQMSVTLTNALSQNRSPCVLRPWEKSVWVVTTTFHNLWELDRIVNHSPVSESVTGGSCGSTFCFLHTACTSLTGSSTFTLSVCNAPYTPKQNSQVLRFWGKNTFLGGKIFVSSLC